MAVSFGILVQVYCPAQTYSSRIGNSGLPDVQKSTADVDGAGDVGIALPVRPMCIEVRALAKESSNRS